MTVSLPPRTTNKAHTYDAAQRREIALTYASRPHGTKATYARSVEVHPRTILVWLSALSDGNLETGSFPRKTGIMTRDHVAEIRRLEKRVADEEKKVKQLQQENARQAKEFEAQRKKWQDTDESWRKAVDGLGKAIELMQSNGTR